jgi:hypothetical protein
MRGTITQGIFLDPLITGHAHRRATSLQQQRRGNPWPQPLNCLAGLRFPGCTALRALLQKLSEYQNIV